MISVIVPIYKVEPYLRQCLDSIINQTYKNLEIILVDDCSPDRCGEICDEYAEKDPRIHLFHNELNQGLYKSRETGLSIATGDYIGWVDADDYIEPQMYEVLYNAAVENSSELVICDYSWVPHKIATKGKWFRDYKGIVDTTFVEQNSQVWNKLVKRELLERLKIRKHFVSCFDEIYIHVLMEAKNPVTINQSLYNYRVGDRTMSSSYKDVAHYRAFVEASKALREVMSTVIHEAYWKDYFDYRVIYYLLMTMIVAAYSGDKEAYQANHSELLSVQPQYDKNQHFWRVLKENYGMISAFVIGKIVPFNYRFARVVCSVKLK